MNTEAVIGIDIGGTYTKLGVVDKEGNLYYEDAVETDKYDDPNAFVEALAERFKIFYYTGNVEFAPNLIWKGVIPFAEIFRSKFNVPVVLTNDANAAAIGEMIFGAAQNMQNFLMITLGTGLGSGLIVNGDIVYGFDGFAGELGHVCVVEKGRRCGCGKRGCLETYVSASGIKRTVFELLATETDDSGFRDIPFNQLDSKQITLAANNGDKIAKKAFEKTGKILGTALADTVAHISPEAIFLFGGLALAGKWIFEPTKAAMEDNLLEIFKGKINILPSALLHKNIAVLGAAALIWKELK